MFDWLSKIFSAPDNTTSPAQETPPEPRADRASPELRIQQSALLRYVLDNKEHYPKESVEEIQALHSEQYKESATSGTGPRQE